MCWLTVKFGLLYIAKLFIGLKSLPLTGSQRVEAMEKYSSLAEKDVVVLEEFITSQCPVTLSTFLPAPQDMPSILAPLVSQCYDCDGNLVSNHFTQVKCWCKVCNKNHPGLQEM